MRARVLFDETATYQALAERLDRGDKIETLDSEDVRAEDGALPMFVLGSEGELQIITAGDKRKADRGGELIGLAPG